MNKFEVPTAAIMCVSMPLAFFFSRGFSYPEVGGDTFLQNVGL
jgi:hypothetical protein